MAKKESPTKAQEEEKTETTQTKIDETKARMTTGAKTLTTSLKAAVEKTSISTTTKATTAVEKPTVGGLRNKSLDKSGAPQYEGQVFVGYSLMRKGRAYTLNGHDYTITRDGVYQITKVARKGFTGTLNWWWTSVVYAAPESAW